MTARRKEISPQQTKRIQELSKQGLNTNQIQRTLSREGLGVRRQTLLGYIRAYRNKTPKANRQNYIPTRYRRSHFSGGKGVASYGTVNGKSKRVQLYGNGKSLYQAMRLVSRNPPIEKFLTIDAVELLSHPRKYLARGDWDARPKVKS